MSKFLTDQTKKGGEKKVTSEPVCTHPSSNC